MSEADVQSSRDSAVSGPGPADSPGAGHVIRTAREAQGQTLMHLSILLKISERRLQAFEDGRWDEVGDRTFVRALAQSLCRHLGVDPRPVLQALPAASVQPREQPDRGRLSGSTPPRLKALRQPVRGPGLVIGAALVTPVRVVVAVILAGALGLALAPSEWWMSAPAQLPSVEVAPGSVGGSAPASPSASEPASEASSSAVAPLSPTPQPTTPTAGNPASSAPGPASATVDPVASGGSSSVVGLASSPLQIIARQDTWVQVSDARGQALLSRLLRSGEQVGLDGARPLRVRVGNAAGTELVWQGKRVALDAGQRNNVADVELP